MESKEVMGMREEGLEMEMMVSGCLRRVVVVIIDEDKNKISLLNGFIKMRR